LGTSGRHDENTALISVRDDGASRVSLTPREHEVLAAMADGASNKVIARRLGISLHTAKFHVAAILAKLDADSRTEAVARAAHLGLVML
jgi:DNA-binding NarL/FixJ family response regulator